MPAPSADSIRTLFDQIETLGRQPNRSSPDAPVAAFNELRTALSHHLDQPENLALWSTLLTVRRAASELIASLPHRDVGTPLARDARKLVREISRSGVHDRAAEAGDLLLARSNIAKGWPGILGAMLLVSARQWPDASRLAEVPACLQADYTRWLFAEPLGLGEPGQAAAYATHALGRLEELVRWLKRGPAAPLEQAVLAAYANHSSLLPLCAGTDNLRRHAELHGRLLQRLLRWTDDRYRVPVRPRAGRRLRIGIISRHFESTAETYAMLPLFEKLDPERFEVVLFAYLGDYGRLEDYCRQKASAMRVLPAEIQEQLTMLREAELDVAVFCTSLAAKCNVVTRLAQHRIAALQMTGNASPITSGLPEMDFYVTGDAATTAELPGQFTERLGLLPGPTHAFNFEADRLEAQTACTRADFGLPADAPVFVSTAPTDKITAEVQQAWARLLAAVPGTYLLVHPCNPQGSSGDLIRRVHAELGGRLAGLGVDPARLVVSNVSFPSRSDVKRLVGLGDIYLDTFPFSAVESLVAPLELGLPAVAWEGGTLRSRTGASLLRCLGQTGLIAGNAGEYHAIAVRLAIEPFHRESCRVHLRAQLEQTPLFLDARAASRAFGELLESAFDELLQGGRAAFRANRAPLRAARTPPQIGAGMAGPIPSPTVMLKKISDTGVTVG